MTAAPCFSPSKYRQRGVSVITAIFLLLLFAALAGFMATLLSTANVTSAQDALGMRARLAAQAGVEWGLFQLDPNDGVAALPGCFAATVLNQIPGYSVRVTCDSAPAPAAAPFAEAGRTLRIYRIVATATALGAAPVAVERQVAATMEKCRDPGVSAAPFGC